MQLSGGTTYTVSLPKSWAQEQGIDSGSLLYLHPEGDGSLLIESDDRRDAAERTVRLDVRRYDDDALRETIEAMYVVGFDRLALVDATGHSADRRRMIRDLTGRFSGFEVLETTETTLVLENLITADNVSIRKSALRLRLIMLAMHRDAVRAVVDNDPALARQVVRRDDEADKLFAMITRHFRRGLSDLQEVERLGNSRAELFEYYAVARQFERVADHAEKIARLAHTRPDAPADPLAEAFSSAAGRAQRVVDTAADVVLADADISDAYDALGEVDALVGELDELHRDLYDHESVGRAHFFGLLFDSVRRTAEYGGNIAELSIQRAMRRTGDRERRPEA